MVLDSGPYLVYTVYTQIGSSNMSNVIQLFPKSTVQLYRVEDPGLTWYEQGAVISYVQLMNDCAALDCTIDDVLDEMCIVAL